MKLSDRLRMFGRDDALNCLVNDANRLTFREREMIEGAQISLMTGAAELDRMEAREKALVECFKAAMNGFITGRMAKEDIDHARALLEGK